MYNTCPLPTDDDCLFHPEPEGVCGNCPLLPVPPSQNPSIYATDPGVAPVG